MYLSDVEEGGGTRFPLLNLTVEPKKGRAVLWTSVLDDDPHERDDRTEHEALDVVSGVKYACNVWLHTHAFRRFADLGCENSAYASNWY
jgi:prolyl 4-hydroxylase